MIISRNIWKNSTPSRPTSNSDICLPFLAIQCWGKEGEREGGREGYERLYRQPDALKACCFTGLILKTWQKALNIALSRRILKTQLMFDINNMFNYRTPSAEDIWRVFSCFTLSFWKVYHGNICFHSWPTEEILTNYTILTFNLHPRSDILNTHCFNKIIKPTFHEHDELFCCHVSHAIWSNITKLQQEFSRTLPTYLITRARVKPPHQRKNANS